MLIRFCKARWIALLLGALGAVAVPAGAVTPFVTSHGTLSEPATGLALGPDGALWHTSRGEPPRIGRTNLAGRTVEVPLFSNARPGDIVRGPDNAMWFVDERGAVLRFGADATARVVRELDASPVALAAGPDGNLWVALAAAEGKGEGIGRLTPEGDLTVFAEDDLPGSPADLAVGWDGAMWFTMPSADRIGRVTSAGVVTEFPSADAPLAIVAGLDGAMWFTTAKDGIGRMDLDGTSTKFSDGLARSARPGDIALGPDGALWFTLHKEIGRIDTGGAMTTFPVGDMQPRAIVAGWDGGMWFTDAASNTLGRIGFGPAAASTPVLGETFVGSAKNGKIRVRVPGRRKSVPLTAAATLPFGTVIDATAGALKLRTALPGGQTQTGTFYGGRFKIVQSPRKGVVRIALRGRLDCGRQRGTTATASRKRRKRRRVWGSDGGGLFETLGLNSITTVRGTRWLTEDRCGGTLTRVAEGSVVVRDRRTGKRIVVKAGQRYFARKR